MPWKPWAGSADSGEAWPLKAKPKPDRRLSPATMKPKQLIATGVGVRAVAGVLLAKLPETSPAGPADAAQLEFKPEPDALGGGMGEEGAGRAPARPPGAARARAGRGREAAVAPNAASAFATDDRQVQAQAVAPQGDDVEASPARAKADAREAPQSAPSDVDTAPGRDEIPSRLEESSRTDVVDPARPKRSGWWQRARAS